MKVVHVSTIDVHGVETVSAECKDTPTARWLTIRFDDFKVVAFATSDKQAARFERIADAIALVNAEMDAKAKIADAAFAFTIAAE